MKIVINGAPYEVSATTLAGLLQERGIAGRVATAVNEEFVPAGLRASHPLRDGDRVEILAPMQGG
ncbi:sulfur carrier protein ThiS [Yangia mangrovi]|uniref:Sulfur carrier protein ThiS n=1 Tax=Alloyangia mangrovi TaxID=1779329 RepID=A0A2A3JQC8_9RHOB|nr:sulfur carrier protein ThiS [Alloyangia mangrovi]MCA0941679.1 sulfur carrier protein ThiS [Alloyangia pacifica]MCA0946943.1 sulfur carrier protein ThiS [Alloyangia pacifica]MCT4371911.1 sulfur carrier protein ThiS [Alloyangia mangrovi]